LLAPHNYTKIIWVGVLGYLVFGDVPNLNMWTGTLVIVLAGVYVLYRERRGA
jgi:drug/metabolite transporter (DMT)-like permease